MVKVVICIGSSCHLKGARSIIENWQERIKTEKLSDEIDLSGTFCMNKCNNDGVSVTVDSKYYAVKPENADDFFNNKILKKIKIN